MTSLFEDVIDNKLVESNKKQPKRDYLGSSVLGDKCSRKIQYMFLGTEPDPGKDFDARTYRIFSLVMNLKIVWLVGLEMLVSICEQWILMANNMALQ